MRISNKIFSTILCATVLLAGCNKEKGLGPNYRGYTSPAIPVTVQNQVDNRPDPTVTTSLSGSGAIQIILTIPSTSGRTIKEITKVATATSYVQIQSTGASGFYTTTPIAGSGATVTFNTSITEYFAKNPVSGTNPAAKQDTELTLRYYFMVTLDDGSVLYPMPVRVLVLK